MPGSMKRKLPGSGFVEMEVRRLLHVVDEDSSKVLCNPRIEIIGALWGIGEYPHIATYCVPCITKLLELTRP